MSVLGLKLFLLMDQVEDIPGGGGNEPQVVDIQIRFRGDELLKPPPKPNEIDGHVVDIHSLIQFEEDDLEVHERGWEACGIVHDKDVELRDADEYDESVIEAAADRIYLDF